MTEIERAAECLRAGKLVAFPTETVYGLGADALNAQAVAGIYAAKGRPADHPLIVHGADGDTLLRLARRVPAPAWVLIERFWPGPLTLVLSRAASVSDAVTGGQGTVALRVPDHPLALALLAEFGGPLVAPSANRFGRISPTTAEHVQEELGSAVDFILDGGPCQVGVESAIVDLSGDAPRLLRPGGV
ncbi:MAG: L-threonylcarbamoyladenylate synthase, partial [Pseudomonas sp.]|uniref:L-threonylcarbamoyladenylate synthase n=1 Tax=Pseudomonas sp. TaxID=306 RepID=UPI003BB74421